MKDFIDGFFAPWIVYALILIFHLLLPARKVIGYVHDPKSGEPFRYRLNGPFVLIALCLAWGVSAYFRLLPWDWLYIHRWPALLGACVCGLVFSFAIVMPAPRAGKSWLGDFYRGRAENPQFSKGRVDAKMFLYLAGAAMLALNLLSFLAHHVMAFGIESSPGIILYCGLFFWFLIDYLVFERVHLYTYDFLAERVGFKLGWGCLVFYPFFYPIGLWATAGLPDPRTPSWLLILFSAVFFSGWALSRGANMQKYFFKTSPNRVSPGFLKPRTITDGKNALLCGGFWGLSRHINYLGEILMAVGLTLCLGRPLVWAAWLYPLYYVALLLPRERSDERRCAAKYGELWKEYERRVPRRIIPGVY
jgi:protein-S-isoprenylcysteine O-methyltransferase Ste14